MQVKRNSTMAISPLAPLDIVQVRQATKNDTQYALNVMKFLVLSTAGPGAVTVGDVATWFDNNLSGALKAIISNAATYWGYGARLLNRPLELELYADGSKAIGTAGAGLLPTQSAPLVSFRTLTAGPTGRGRAFLPFPPPASIDATSALTVAFKNLVQAWVTGLVGPINVTDVLGTSSAIIRLIVTNTARTHLSQVITGLVRNFMASQRRREELHRADVDPFIGSVHV